MPKTSVAKSAVRSHCLNGTHHGFGRVFAEIAWLQRIEYANLNCQDTYTETLTEDGFHQGGLGSGCTANNSQWTTHNNHNPFVPCGVTAPLGNNTGKVTFTVKNWQNGGTDKDILVTSYRGLETPFEYLTCLADDLLAWHKEDKSELYVCEDPTKFASPADSAATVPDGYVAETDLPRQEGFGLTLSFGDHAYGFIDEVGGAENKGVCDKFYTPLTAGFTDWGWYGALLAGNANNGANAGFGYLNTNNRSSNANANIGFRLYRGFSLTI